MSNRTRGRVRELGDHRVVWRKMVSPRKRPTLRYPDQRRRSRGGRRTPVRGDGRGPT